MRSNNMGIHSEKDMCRGTGGITMAVKISELETPAVLIDLDRLDANLKKTAELAERAGVRLRPHIKTHKSKWIMNQQLKYGAAGITTATLGEAEIMADGGAEDILIAYPIVGTKKLQRLAQLLKRVKVTVSTDDVEVARGLSELGEQLNRRIPIYVDVNTGLNRCGREPGEETANVVEQIVKLKGIEVTGLMTHAGHVYGRTDQEEIRAVARNEAESLVMTKQLLEKRGIEIREISVGSTPTSKFIGEQSGVTEIRPGAYVFGDAIQVSTGVITEQECAMTVLATVVSTPRPGTVIVDAGSKTITSDVNPHKPGHGYLKGNPDVYLEKLSEEHGVVRVPEGVQFQIGDRLEFVPNHCCTVTNLHNELVGVRDGHVIQMISVDARGCVI